MGCVFSEWPLGRRTPLYQLWTRNLFGVFCSKCSTFIHSSRLFFMFWTPTFTSHKVGTRRMFRESWCISSRTLYTKLISRNSVAFQLEKFRSSNSRILTQFFIILLANEKSTFELFSTQKFFKCSFWVLFLFIQNKLSKLNRSLLRKTGQAINCYVITTL